MDNRTVYGLAAIRRLAVEIACEIRGHRGVLICARCGSIIASPQLVAASVEVSRRIGAAFGQFTSSAAEAGAAMGRLFRRIEEDERSRG